MGEAPSFADVRGALLCTTLTADHVKRSLQGKIETVTMQQARESMKPFFKLLKHKVRLMAARSYHRVGFNAPFPLLPR